MAIDKANPICKAKLVYQIEDLAADTGYRKTTRTFSNLQSAAEDQNIYDGLAAVGELLDATSVNIMRVDESQLVKTE